MKRSKNKKNVIWLHSHFLYWMGGTKFIYQVISEIKKSRKIGKIIIGVERSSNLIKKNYQEIGLEINEINVISSNNIFYWLLLPVFLLVDLLNLRRLIKKNNLKLKDTIVISSMFPMNVVAEFSGIKHIQNCYEPFAFFYDEEFISQFSWLKKIFLKILALIYIPLDTWATKRAEVLLTLNTTTQKTIKTVYGRNSVKTQAGVDSSFFKPYVSVAVQKKYHGRKIVIHSTDYSPVKGTDKVITAFARVVEAIPEALLLITTTIDDSARRTVYEQLTEKLRIHNKVRFLGFVPIKLLPQYYSLASAMVQGASSEKSGTTSMSLPVKEEMCCETPAIRPDMGGEDVQDNKTGFLVDPNNTHLLTKKIIFLLRHDALAKKMGKMARKTIKEKYTWKKTAQVFLDQLR